MKKILFSILSLGVVAVVAIGATRASFSDTDEILGNTINTKFLEISLDGSGNAYTHHMNFPLEIAPGETTRWIEPNGGERGLRFNILIADGSMIPDHYELRFQTSDFVSGTAWGHGSPSTRNQYTRVIEVISLYAKTGDWDHHNLISQIDDSQDGNPGFISLYDLERSLIDDVPASEALNVIGFDLKMAETAGNQFQGDRIDLDVLVGAAQVPGQTVFYTY